MDMERKHGIISRRTTGTFGYHAWGTVTKLTDGTLVAGCSGGRIYHVCPFGKSMLFFSHDDGETWSAPMIVNDTWLDDRDVGLTALPNNGLLMSWFSLDYDILDKNDAGLRKIYSAEEYQMTNAYRAAVYCNPEEKPGSFIRVSKDGGMTWGEAVEVPVSAPHGPILLQDGSLLYLGKRRTGAEGEKRELVAYGSIDNGVTWKELGYVPLMEGTSWEYMFEPHAVQLPSGRILGAIRYEGGPYMNMEQRYLQWTTLLTWSDDGGRTWSMPHVTGICGSPPHLMRHSSGAIVLSYGRREIGNQCECVRISRDEGETWSPEIVICDNVPDWDMGYASTVELSDGSLLTAYYQKYREGDKVDKKTSFLYTKWTLPERKDA